MSSYTKERTYKVAGVSHYEENIMNLSLENEDYFKTKRGLIDDDLIGERVWKYKFLSGDVELVPEPENPEDANAIKVIIDGEHVGYIKRGSCAHIHKLLKTDAIADIDCTIGGGPYKYVFEEYDDEKEKDVYTLEKGETQLFVHLQISEKTNAPEAPGKVTEKETVEAKHFTEENPSENSQPQDDNRNRPSYPAPAMQEEPKSRWVAFFLCLFLGGIGAHRFYVGKVGTGILYLFTGGCLGIGTIVDLVLILCNLFDDADDRPLV